MMSKEEQEEEQGEKNPKLDDCESFFLPFPNNVAQLASMSSRSRSTDNDLQSENETTQVDICYCCCYYYC